MPNGNLLSSMKMVKVEHRAMLEAVEYETKYCYINK